MASSLRKRISDLETASGIRGQAVHVITVSAQDPDDERAAEIAFRDAGIEPEPQDRVIFVVRFCAEPDFRPRLVSRQRGASAT